MQPSSTTCTIVVKRAAIARIGLDVCCRLLLLSLISLSIPTLSKFLDKPVTNGRGATTYYAWPPCEKGDCWASISG